jgi:hypothetical protein
MAAKAKKMEYPQKGAKNAKKNDRELPVATELNGESTTTLRDWPLT